MGDASRQSRADISGHGSVTGRENGGGGMSGVAGGTAGRSGGLEDVESAVLQQVMRKIVDEGLLAAAATAAVKAGGGMGRGGDGKVTPRRDAGGAAGVAPTAYFVSDNSSFGTR